MRGVGRAVWVGTGSWRGLLRAAKKGRLADLTVGGLLVQCEEALSERTVCMDA